MKSKLSRSNSQEKWAAIALISLAAGLPILPWAGSLGFYRDDWHVLWASVVQGASGIINQHTLDRPVMGILYAGVDLILGHTPAAWQVFAWVVRVAGAWIFFEILRSVWQDRKPLTLLMALLFVVYPGFYQQGNANTYQNHLLALLFGLASILLTIKALPEPKKIIRVGLIAASVLLSLVCYLMFEWMIGLEGLRFALLWTLIARENLDAWRKQIKKFFLNWLPWAGAAGIFLVWRLVFFKSARSVTDTGALARRLISSPWPNILRMFVDSLKDVFEVVFSAWFYPLYQLSSEISNLGALAGAGLAFLAVAALWGYWQWVAPEGFSPLGGAEKNRPAAKTMVWIGLFSVAVAIFPPILAERNVEFRDGLDRYSLTAMAGAVILIGGLLLAGMNPKAQKWAGGTLLAAGILTQFSGMAYFRNFWDYQRQLWWQLSWRAPDLKDNAALIPLLPPGYRLAEGYEVWGPANLIYRPDSAAVKISGDALNNQSILYLLDGLNLGRSMRKVDYTVDFKNSLVMSIPAAGSCLHVLDGENVEYSPDDDPLIRLAGGYSKISMIQAEGQVHLPPAEIFGREPEHTWCYYYQKASLARQRQDWQEIGRLGDEAARKGYQPQDISEWLPFYEGYVHLWDYEQADRIAGILRSNHFFIVDYCQKFQNYTPEPNAPDEAGQFFVENLCGQLEGIS